MRRLAIILLTYTLSFLLLLCSLTSFASALKAKPTKLIVDTARIVHQKQTNTLEVYMNLTNHSLKYPVTIIGVFSPASKRAKLNRFSFHQGSYIKRHTQKITIHPNSHSDFRPGSVHIELQEPIKNFALGEMIPVHLILANGQSVKVNAIVEKAA
ncbi:hypothetical protein Psal006b_01449 [Piscirickettsia salmonis]|uniref:Copper chaperone n=1 Tax=Piscirickettsia salmonis TaxID=1238 RepID=A0A1L6TC54_PISSA|nr:copper chaperone PCu(A)C [Piscirickettsia salmonis]AKP74069.1 hypothetical protein PSLF89_2380 [Piscirickettsia salmonis LF-89 = ATCC VR-1361]ALB22939.1 copper chaperone [Piscirickettsia salmonis]ALY02891.1 hypothetical protein AWE47_08595 [Piscirickettsia salmonis]AMA42446.1 hypothetical protein AWJ11_08810 [Piscirickettsia salmonis]AOS34916.1 hypothetical protein AVM72_05950 [Piscirickettsia salmonis]